MDASNQKQQELELLDAVVNVGESHLPAEVRRNRVSTPLLSNPAAMLNVPVEVIMLQQDSPIAEQDSPLSKTMPSEVVAVNGSGTPQEKVSFLRELENFYRERNAELKTNKFYGQPIDLYKLWNEVIKLGGYDKVSELKKWRQVGDSFNPPTSCTAISAIFRGFYEKALLEFEKYKRQKGELQLPSANPAQRLSSRVEVGDCQASGSGCAQKDAAAGATQNLQAGSSEPADRGLQNGGVTRLITDIGHAADWVKINVQQIKDGYDIYALVPGMHNDEVKVEADFHGRVIITGIPGEIDNVWGIKPFQKVISLPSKIDPALTQATFNQLGRLHVRVHSPQGSA